MKKQCIFKVSKFCDECGECNSCDIDSTKICTNCGKCLELENNDYKKVVIEEIDELENLEDEESSIFEMPIIDEYTKISIEDSDTLMDEELAVEYLEDVEGLTELLEDTNTDMLVELFPGFFTVKNTNKGLH